LLSDEAAENVSRVTMNIFLTGVSCVGKSTLGKILADRLNYQFYDLDSEIEKYFGESIERLMSRYLTGHNFRYRIGVVVLKDIHFNRSSNDSKLAAVAKRSSYLSI